MPKTLALSTAISLLLLGAAARADVHPNALFSDHAVLQQAMDIPVWGTADPGESVTVTLNKDSQTATADNDGKWLVRLPAQKAAGLDAPATTLTIKGKNEITINDVLIGEVWLASGQSNMEFTVSKKVKSFAGMLNEDEVIAKADFPKIRMFTVKQAKSRTPLTTLSGAWEVCSPKTVPAFSAVGYLFARDLQRDIHQPVGIINTSYGAATAEAWASREALAADPRLKRYLDTFDSNLAAFDKNPQVTLGELPPEFPKPTPINKKRQPPTARLGNPVNDQHEATVLFNGQLNPIIPYAIKGAIWYQGESLTGGKTGLNTFGHLTSALITDWRTRWHEGDFPFLIVQIPGQQDISNNPLVREQQNQVLQLKNTGIACIIDTGEAKNVHPKNKEPVGERLDRLALALAYGQKIETSGPVFDSLTIDGNKAIVKFTHTDGQLVAKGGPLKWFQVAGADQKFHDAVAEINGDTVVLTSPDVPAPVAVRYAWDNFPDGANLFNKDNLPASPFRTDTWDYPIPGLVE
ncbi:MAG TPA: sialate O-acetylesterase [Phycisphaerae bacterium]|nr:sialate O-acetylesterase [Phycisphaerae bacterium]